MTKRDINAIADALTGRGRYGHSPLYWWMWDHFDELRKERLGRADWRSATEKFTELGFTSRNKTPLNRENVRKTWERVVRDREKHSAKRASVEAPPRPPDTTEPPQVLQPPQVPKLAPPVEAHEDDGEEEVEFTVASGKTFRTRVPKI